MSKFKVNPTRSIPSLIQRLRNHYKNAIPPEDEVTATSYLKFISYTRQKLYFSRLATTEPGISFYKVIKSYDLNRKLKLLALDGLERI